MAAKPLSAAGCEQDALNLCHDAIIHPATICRKKKREAYCLSPSGLTQTMKN
jgi:hypothetical protein